VTTQFRQLIQHDEYQQTTAIHCNSLVALCHGLAVEGGWWHDPATGAQRDRNDGELICLMHSELSEAMEAVRKSKQDDHLPQRPGVEVELADAVIRIADLCGALQLDLGGAIAEKMQFNASRPDHKPENRAASGGKAY